MSKSKQSFASIPTPKIPPTPAETSTSPLPSIEARGNTELAGAPPEKPKGGRPSNAELAAEVKAVHRENQTLRKALAPFAELPEEPGCEDLARVIYTCSRHGRTAVITCNQIRAAAAALRR